MGRSVSVIKQCVCQCVCVPWLSPCSSFASAGTGFPEIQRGSLGGAAGGFPGGPLHPSAPHTPTPHASVFIQRAALKCRQEEKSDVAVDT